MSEYCDFAVQETIEGEDGRRLRPDMIVRLPNNRVIAVDSKAPTEPLSHYLESEGRFDRVVHGEDASHGGLLHAAEADAARRWRFYEQLASLPVSRDASA